MSIYATSAQVAHDFGIDHDLVMQVIDNLDLADFKKIHIQAFNIGHVRLAQMSETGYNAVVLNIPLNSGGDDDLLIRWKETFFNNRAPNLSTLIAGISDRKSIVNTLAIQKNSTDEETRRKAESMIYKGDLDESITKPFAVIHRELCVTLGNDPGYQNVRIYATARRKELGIKSGMIPVENNNQ